MMYAIGTMITPPLDPKKKAEREAKRKQDPHFQAMERAEHIIEFIEGKKRCYAYGFDKKAGIMRDYSEKEYRELQAAEKIALDL